MNLVLKKIQYIRFLPSHLTRPGRALSSAASLAWILECTCHSRINIHLGNFTKFCGPLTKFKNTFKRSAAPVSMIMSVWKASWSRRHTATLPDIPRVLARPWHLVRRQMNQSGCMVHRKCLPDGRQRKKILNHFEIQLAQQAKRKHSDKLAVDWTQRCLLRINNLKLKFPVRNVVFYCRIFNFFLGTSVAFTGDGSVPGEESNHTSGKRSFLFNYFRIFNFLLQQSSLPLVTEDFPVRKATFLARSTTFPRNYCRIVEVSAGTSIAFTRTRTFFNRIKRSSYSNKQCFYFNIFPLIM